MNSRVNNLLLLILGLLLCPCARADTSLNWKALQKVTRIAVIPPFFCTQAARPTPATEKDQSYQKILSELTTTFARSYTRHLTERQRFELLPADVVAKRLQTLKWTPRDLYAQKAVLNGKDWPLPDKNRLRVLAKLLKVDGVLINAMRDPASIGQGVQFYHENWNPNPLNWSLRRFPAHVVSPTVQSILITAQGIVAWKDEEMAEHPRTKPTTPRTLRADWLEATDEVSQQLVESLTRMPPPGSEVAPMPVTPPSKNRRAQIAPKKPKTSAKQNLREK